MNAHLLHAKPMKALVTTVLVLLLMGVGSLVMVNTSVFNPLETALEQFHFSDIYFHWHRGHNTDAESDMILVDIQYLHEREEIATLLDSIATQHPRVVAMDVIFPQAVSLNPLADSHLVAAVDACSLVVLAQNIVPQMDGSWGAERSFFADGHIEGAVNMPANVVRYAYAQFDSMPTFAAQVVLATGASLPEKEQLIDFGGNQLMRWTVGSEDFYLPMMEDKIVFVGDFGDLRDYHNIPIGAGGQSRMSGTEIHALATAALLSAAPYHELPRGWSIVLQIISLYLFCLLIHILPQAMDNWIIGALQILFILLLLPMCYMLFISAHLILSPTFILIGFGLSGFAKNITDVIIKN